jgi:ParB family chromosome partitioning protein
MTITTVPFKDLAPADAINARSKTVKDGLDELAESIARRGLIQPLAVRPADNGRYEIIDGRRRWQAMQRLVRARTWKKDTAVPVLVRNEDDVEALETSLVANTVRLPMHPVDQHEVFARLADQGLTAADIAARFGIAEKTVRQHMALGRLAPEIRDAWRKGKIDAKAAQAFTVEPRHELQVAAYERLRKSSYMLTDYYVRQELAGDRLRADSVPAQILEAYYAAGGTVSEDLFEEERYIDDGALFAKVRAEAIEAERQRLLADGWSWVARSDELPSHWRWQWPKVHEHVEPIYTAEEEADAAELDAQLSAGKLKGKDAAAAEERLEALERRAQERAYTPEDRARSGVVLVVGSSGAFEAALGIIRPADEAASADAAPEDMPDDLGDSEDDAIPVGSHPPQEPETVDAAADDSPRISNALLESLTTTLTLAAQRALPADPSLALRAAVASLTADPWNNPIKISLHGHGANAKPRELGGSFAAKLAALAKLSDAELMKRFAALMAEALDLVSYNAGSDRSADEALRDALPAEPYLAAARDLFNAADYFSRAPKQIAETALAEMGRPVMAGAKKSDLASMAAALAKEMGWLPPELRHPEYRLLTEQEAAA